MASRGGDYQGSWDEATLQFAGLSRVRLDALLQELLGRVDEMLESQDRLRALLDAVVGIGSDLDLNSALDRIVSAACELSGARYGALGVLAPDGGRLARFITHGVTSEEISVIGKLPEGHGILGLLIDHPTPLRLTEIAEHPQSFGFPANHPPMRSFLGVPIRTRHKVFGNLYLTEKPGAAEFTADDEQVVTALATAAGVVIDNARLYADTERRRRWHEATAEITQLVLGEFDPPEALRLIARRAREVSGGAVAAVLLEDLDALVIEAVDGAEPLTALTDTRLPAGHPVARKLIGLTRTLVVPDVAQRAKDEGVAHLVPQVEEFGRALFVPMPAGVRTAAGVLVVVLPREASSTGSELIEGFASQATLALDRAQAQRDRWSLAVLEDRDRIARDLHDLVIQRLFATGLQLQGLQRIVRPAIQDRITRAVDDIDATIRDLRAAIFELHDQPGQPESLRTAIRLIVEEYSESLGFVPELRFRGPLDSAVPARVRAQILAAVREAMSNVLRHAQAGSVLVEVAVDGTEVVTRVSDDGTGMTGTGRESGLRNLRERAATLGGAVRLEPNQPHGTVLELRAPLVALPSS